MFVGYDAVTPANLPSGGDFYCAYVDGLYANVPQVRARFPHARLITIAVSAAHDAMCLDIENGDATPAQAPEWVIRQIGRGLYRPIVYASQSLMPEVIAELTSHGIARAEYRCWTAHYTEPHICSTAVCKAAGYAADGTQWAGWPGNSPGPYDISLLAVDFFDAPTPAPPVQEDTDMPVVTRCTDAKAHPQILVTGVLDVPVWLETEADVAAYTAVGKAVKLTPATFVLLLARAVTK